MHRNADISEIHSPLLLAIFSYFTSVTQLPRKCVLNPHSPLLVKYYSARVRVDDAIYFSFVKVAFRSGDFYTQQFAPRALLLLFLYTKSCVYLYKKKRTLCTYVLFVIVLWLRGRSKVFAKKNNTQEIFLHFFLVLGYFRNERVCFRECTIFLNASINSAHFANSFSIKRLLSFTTLPASTLLSFSLILYRYC